MIFFVSVLLFSGFFATETIVYSRSPKLACTVLIFLIRLKSFSEDHILPTENPSKIRPAYIRKDKVMEMCVISAKADNCGGG